MKIKLSTIISLILFINLNSFAQLPEDFSDQLVLNNLDIPMGLTFDQNGQGYFWEKKGLIYIIDTNGVQLAPPLLDIQEECANWEDHGINCVALDANFQENGYFYVAYVVERNYLLNKNNPDYDPNIVFEKEATIGRITRWQADISTNFTTLVPNSRKVLLGENKENGIPIFHVFHGVGTIIYSPDGSLLISVGDSSPGFNFEAEGGDDNGYADQAIENQIITPDQRVHAFRAQYLGSLNGKVLRIDAETGEGLSSNPFFDNENPASIQSKIWATGLRNPYRMCLRPETSGHSSADGQPGVLVIGDVGEGSWEEINVSKNGGENFGWPIYEGEWPHFHYGKIENDLPNSLAANPHFSIGNCEEFFKFHDLFKKPNGSGISPVFNNPCDNNVEIPENVFPSVETPPAIIWSNQRWNQPAKTRVPYFPNIGQVQYISTDEPDAPISSEIFDGYSALAGVFYEGNIFPEIYKNKLFTYDFSGWIQVFDFDENHNLISITPFHNAAEKIIHLAENPKDGCLYYINTDNEIRKICFGGNPPPIAIAKADNIYGNSPLTVQFNGTESYDIFNLPIVEYLWDFGNGETSNDSQPIYEFQTADNQPKAFPVKLIVTDSLGAKGETEIIISLNNTPPEVEITSLESGWHYALDESSPIELLAQVTDNEQPVSVLNFKWAIDFHHNVHAHPGRRVETEDAYFLIVNEGCDGEEYWYQVDLTVSDSFGLSTKVTKFIFPDCEDAFVEFENLSATSENSVTIIFKFSTLFEENVDRFEIQRSQDFLQFYPIGEVAVNSLKNYAFTDNFPIKGTNIYRVKAISSEGRFSYSDIAEIDFSNFPSVYVFPNPVQDFTNIYYKNPQNEQLEFRLFNAAGSLIYENNWEAVLGKPLIKKINTHFLRNGAYFFQIIGKDESKAGSFIIQK